nr:MAG TPA: Methylamine dehydrogenase heavy chain [Caudoviricetes sp.]
MIVQPLLLTTTIKVINFLLICLKVIYYNCEYWRYKIIP